MQTKHLSAIVIAWVLIIVSGLTLWVSLQPLPRVALNSGGTIQALLSMSDLPQLQVRLKNLEDNTSSLSVASQLLVLAGKKNLQLVIRRLAALSEGVSADQDTIFQQLMADADAALAQAEGKASVIEQGGFLDFHLRCLMLSSDSQDIGPTERNIQELRQQRNLLGVARDSIEQAGNRLVRLKFTRHKEGRKGDLMTRQFLDNAKSTMDKANSIKIAAE